MSLLWGLLLAAVHLAGWVSPWLDLSALALVAIGWGLSLDRAAVLAWGLGFLMDGASLGPLGVQAMAWSSAASAMAVEQRATHRAETGTLIMAAALTALWLGAVSGLINPGRLLTPASIGALSLRAAATALAAPLVLWPVRRFWRPRQDVP